MAKQGYVCRARRRVSMAFTHYRLEASTEICSKEHLVKGSHQSSSFASHGYLVPLSISCHFTRPWWGLAWRQGLLT